MAAQETPASTRAAVDVLAVMAREIEEARKRVPFMHPEGPQNAEHQREYEEAGDGLVQLREARAAVAELIEAASDHMNGLEIGEVARKKRLLIALARVTGGAQ